jgi:hypothetical protein
LRSKLKVRSDEEPVIGGYENPDNWLMLTTNRLVWAISGKRNEIDVGMIYDTGPDLLALRRRGKTKQDWDELQILTSTTDQFTVRVEPGPPLFGILSVLKNAAGRSRRRS